jgi:hypothetical protein
MGPYGLCACVDQLCHGAGLSEQGASDACEPRQHRSTRPFPSHLHAMSPTACHAALDIPELLRLIFGHLISYYQKMDIEWLLVDRSARADLFNAALVSRAFADAALDVSWSRLDQMKMLRPLLGIQCEKGRHTTCEPLRDAINAERLRGYLARVREVIVKFDAWSEEACPLSHLLAAIPSGVVFPSLTKVSVVISRSILLGNRAASAEIARLMCPSVVEFRFISSNSIDSTDEMNQWQAVGEEVNHILSRALAGRIGDLHTLEVHGGGRRVGPASDPEALLPARNLRRLVLGQLGGATLTSSATQRLLSLPSLQHFHMDNYVSSRRPWALVLSANASSRGLTDLASMHLICPLSDVCGILQALRVVQSVHELSFGHPRPSGWDNQFEAILPPEEWKRHWEAIGASVCGRFSGSLRAIKLQGDEHLISAGPFSVFLEVFRGLPLTSFDYTASPADLRNNTPILANVATIAAQWPSLEHLGLVMSSGRTREGQPLALGTPADIARPFAHLRSLRCGPFAMHPLLWSAPSAKSGIQEVDVACAFGSLHLMRTRGEKEKLAHLLPSAIGYLVRCFPGLQRVTMQRETQTHLLGAVDAMKRINSAIDDLSKQPPSSERCSSFTVGDVVIYRDCPDYDACLVSSPALMYCESAAAKLKYSS